MLSPDSIVPNPTNPQTFNRYSYTLNNPVKYTDPSGHCFVLAGVDLALCIGAVGVLVVVVYDAVSPNVDLVNDAAQALTDLSYVVEHQASQAWDGWMAAMSGDGAEEEQASDLGSLPGYVSGSPGDFDPNDDDKRHNIQFSERQLQKKYKHAPDFGIEGNYNSANSVRFKEAIDSHINSSNTQVIEGTYRNQSVRHYFNLSTKLNVVVDSNNNFVSGWQLSEKQIEYILNTGSLGGG